MWVLDDRFVIFQFNKLFYLLRNEIIGTGNNFQQKAKSQNNWKHGLLLTFREITYLVVKANRIFYLRLLIFLRLLLFLFRLLVL